MNQLLTRLRKALLIWLDNANHQAPVDGEDVRRIDLVRILPFIFLHLMCLGVLVVGVSWFAVLFALFTYLIRMFAITAFYHRYFAHRAFRTNRVVQFLFAMLGATATQRGALWWAAHHRTHHRHSDTEHDPHTPQQGFFWSHMGWFLSRKHVHTEADSIPDLMRYPELRWLDRFDLLMPVLFATGIFLLGGWLETAAPQLGTSAGQLLIWGYFISTVVLIHVTLMINSLAHVCGRRRYATPDHSRNNWLLALLTLGEGWHNNHHHYPGSARQGFYWWEIDISFYLLKLMSWLGLVSDLKPVPAAIRDNRGVMRRRRSKP